MYKYVNPNFDFEEIFGYELAPHPTSMFDEVVLLKMCKQKLKLMTTLIDANPIFLDG